MFCKYCGKGLADDAKFCDGCGSRLDGVRVESDPSAFGVDIRSILGNCLATLKGFFSKNTVKTVGESAKSTGWEWIVFALASALAYALALAVNIKQGINDLLGSFANITLDTLSDSYGVEIYNFGNWFLYGLLISIGTYLLMSILLFLVTKYVFKKNVSIVCVLNLVATASLPLTVAYVLNMLLGLMWLPLVIVVSIAALVMTALLLYVGMQKLDKLDTSPLWAYTGIWAVIVAIILVIICSAVNAAVEDLVSTASSGLGSMLGY